MATKQKGSSISLEPVPSKSVGPTARKRGASREGSFSRTQGVKLHRNTGIRRKVAPKEDSVKDYLLIVNEYSSKP